MALPGDPVKEIPTNDDSGGQVDDGSQVDDNDESDPSVDDDSQVDDDSDPDAGASDDPFAEYGGADSVKQAKEFYDKVQDPDGALETFFSLGRAFGLGVREIEALFGQVTQEQSGEQQSGEQETGPADDDMMTFAQARELLQQELEPFRQQQQQQTETAARDAANTKLNQLGLEDSDTIAAVLQMGDRYLGDDLSPKAVTDAIQKGYDDFVKLIKSNADKYREQKKQQKQQVPKTPKGGSTGTKQPEPEPKDLKEAILRARKKLMG